MYLYPRRNRVSQRMTCHLDDHDEKNRRLILRKCHTLSDRRVKMYKTITIQEIKGDRADIILVSFTKSEQIQI